MKVAFVDAPLGHWPVRLMCSVLGVSVGGYDAWRSRPESLRSIENRTLLGTIRLPCDTHRRHRTVRSKGCLSCETAKIMVFRTIQAAQKSWRKLDGQNQLPKIIEGVKFTDGIETARDHAAA